MDLCLLRPRRWGDGGRLAWLIGRGYRAHGGEPAILLGDVAVADPEMGLPGREPPTERVGVGTGTGQQPWRLVLIQVHEQSADLARVVRARRSEVHSCLTLL